MGKYGHKKGKNYKANLHAAMHDEYPAPDENGYTGNPMYTDAYWEMRMQEERQNGRKDYSERVRPANGRADSACSAAGFTFDSPSFDDGRPSDSLGGSFADGRSSDPFGEFFADGCPSDSFGGTDQAGACEHSSTVHTQLRAPVLPCEVELPPVYEYTEDDCASQDSVMYGSEEERIAYMKYLGMLDDLAEARTLNSQGPVMDYEKRYYVVHANELIMRIRGSLTMNHLRVLLYLVSQLPKRTQEEMPAISVPRHTIYKILQINGTPRSEGCRVRKILNELKNKPVQLETGCVPLLVDVSVNKANKNYVFQFNPALKPMLMGLTKQFTKYDLEYSLRLKSGHSVRLYDVFKAMQFKRIFSVEVNDLREYLGLAEFDENGEVVRYKYPPFNRFKEQVLIPAIAEINEKTDLLISFQTINDRNDSRCILALHFKIKNKPKPPVYENSLPMDRYSKAKLVKAKPQPEFLETEDEKTSKSAPMDVSFGNDVPMDASFGNEKGTTQNNSNSVDSVRNQAEAASQSNAEEAANRDAAQAVLEKCLLEGTDGLSVVSADEMIQALDRNLSDHPNAASDLQERGVVQGGPVLPLKNGQLLLDTAILIMPFSAFAKIWGSRNDPQRQNRSPDLPPEAEQGPGTTASASGVG